MIRAIAGHVKTRRPIRRKPLTTVDLIAHVSAVRSIVTQVFHQDTCPVTTLVLIWHAGPDAGGYWGRCRGTGGR